MLSSHYLPLHLCTLFFSSISLLSYSSQTTLFPTFPPFSLTLLFIRTSILLSHFSLFFYTTCLYSSSPQHLLYLLLPLSPAFLPRTVFLPIIFSSINYFSSLFLHTTSLFTSPPFLSYFHVAIHGKG